MQRVGLLVVGALLMFAASTYADEDTSRVEFAGGWRMYHSTFASFVSPIQVGPPNDFPEGWFADAAFNLSPKFAIVGEAGGTYYRDKSETPGGLVSINESYNVALHTYAGGIRVRAPQHARIVPFGQVLFGGEHDSSRTERTITVRQVPSTSRQERSSSSPVLALDGGMTMMAGVIGVRASVGYARFFSTADADAFRFSLGAALRF